MKGVNKYHVQPELELCKIKMFTPPKLALFTDIQKQKQHPKMLILLDWRAHWDSNPGHVA